MTGNVDNRHHHFKKIDGEIIMGMWDLQPYDNDSAADLLADFMDQTRIREEWRKLITDEDIKEEPEELRALVWVFIQLGHIYVWPIDHYDDDLELAIEAAEKLSKDKGFNEIDGMSELLMKEIYDLKSRRKQD
jgi:hypothetical protein